MAYTGEPRVTMDDVRDASQEDVDVGVGRGRPVYPSDILVHVNVMFLCGLCEGILRNPVRTHCGHR